MRFEFEKIKIAAWWKCGREEYEVETIISIFYTRYDICLRRVGKNDCKSWTKNYEENYFGVGWENRKFSSKGAKLFSCLRARRWSR